ncbi:MAG: hypothetical protein AB8B69_15010 [Chitinophagales bacterium]
MHNLQLLDDFHTEIDETFNKTDLKKAILPIIRPFLLQNEELCMEHGASYSLYSQLPGLNTTKPNLVKIYCLPFLTEKLLEAFRAYIPSEVRSIMDALVWQEHIEEKEIKKQFEVEIAEEGQNSWGSPTQTLKKEYAFFQSDSKHIWKERKDIYTLSLPPIMRRYLMHIYPKPKHYDIHPTKPESTSFTYDGEKDIFLELPRLMVYYKQGNIALTAKDRPTVSSVNKMQKTLNLNDFFGGTKNKYLKNIRSNALITMLTLSKKMKGENDDEFFLKRLFHLYREQTSFYSFPILHTTIKGTGHMDTHWDLKNVEPEIFKLLQNLPQNEWVSYQNIEDYASYRMLPIQPVSVRLAEQRLYFSIKFETGSPEKHYVKKNTFSKEVTHPFLKGSFFMFAAFGLVEIAYNAPDTDQIGGTCFSPYDGLQYVRLTDLGAYVLGKTKEYTKPINVQKVPLILSKDSLMILSDETDSTADILLQNYTQRVGANRYQTDAAIFLKNCKSKTDLQNKISLFKQTVTDKLPPNWNAFFEGLLANINPLKKVTNSYLLMQIPADNKELVRLIAQDAILKKYVLKAENFHILVKKTDLVKFKNRLKEFGFLLT